MPRFLFIGSSVDGNEHGLHVLHLQFIFIRQTALELSELGVKRGLGCKVQREQGRKGKWCLMLFQGLRVIGHCVRIDYQCYWKRGRWVSIPFLMMLPFEESCFCPIACGLVYGMVYMDFMKGLVSLAWVRYLKRFFRGANRVWRLRTIHGKPVWFLKSEEAFAVCF